MPHVHHHNAPHQPRAAMGSRASSHASFVDPVSPLTLSALDSFLRVTPPPAAAAAAAAATRSAVASPAMDFDEPPQQEEAVVAQQPGDDTSSLAAAAALAGSRSTPRSCPSAGKMPRWNSFEGLAGSVEDLQTAAADDATVFASSYFRGRPTAEAFARQRARRLRDAKRRLRNVDRAAAVREARLQEQRTRSYAQETARQRRLVVAARRADAARAHTQHDLDERLRLADERRAAALERRAEAQREADSRRATVRARVAELTGVHAAVQDEACRAACTTLRAVSDAVNETLYRAAMSHDAPPADSEPTTAERAVAASFKGRAVRFNRELHGRMAHSDSVDRVEQLLVTDSVLPCAVCNSKKPSTAATTTAPSNRPVCPVTGERHQQMLPGAAGDLLDVLLTAVELPSTPESSPSKTTTSASPSKGAAAPPSLERLSNPASRDLICRQLIGAHYAAVGHLRPAPAGVKGGDVFTPDGLLGAMACSLVRELHSLIRVVVGYQGDEEYESMRVNAKMLLRFLTGWETYCVTAAEEEARKKRALLESLQQSLVQLRLAEAARQRDIRSKQAAAAAAGPASAQGRRERLVAPRRAALTSAVSTQVASLQRKLKAVGGPGAVAAAEEAATEAVATVEAAAAATASTVVEVEE